MTTTDMTQTTTTQLDTGLDDYSVSAEHIDEAQTKEWHWNNDKWHEYLGYYKKIPELRQAILSKAQWTVGKGYSTEDALTEVRLKRFNGWGEDSFHSIMENMIVTKYINGDAYAEIIKNKSGIPINIKPLNPFRMRTVVNEKGMIIRYEEVDKLMSGEKRVIKKYKPAEILHLVNDRIANEIHGTSVIESVKWVIDAKNEAMSDWRRLSHRSSVRIMYVDEDDTSRLNTLRSEYKDAIKNGEVMILPAKKEEASFEDLPLPPINDFLAWIQYLDNTFYQNVGVPRVILGGSQEFTEAGGKMSFLSFELPIAREQKMLEADLWNQVAIKIKFNRPPSLQDNAQTAEEKNTAQTGIQGNEARIGVPRSE